MLKMGKREALLMHIKRIEKEIRDTPYHKGTEHHIGRLRAKLAKLKDSLVEQESRRAGGGRGGYAVKKQGDATVVLVGPPSVGKSTLLNKLTNAKSKVAPYEFTTVSVIPGMMEYKDAKIQILDVPGLIKGAEEGKGRGREVLSVVRGVDLLIIITDVEDLNALERISKTLEKNGVRINKKPPGVKIEKKAGGGIIVHSNIKQGFSTETVKNIAQQFGIRNGEITIKVKLSLDRLIDAFSPNRVYVPAIYVVNKIDLPKSPNIRYTKYNIPIIKISAEIGRGLDNMKEEIWKNLNFVRVYLVRPGEKSSLNHPIIMKSKATLYDVAEKIGTEFVEGKQRAKIWGTSAKFPGQEVSLSTIISEGMQVRFI